MNVLEVQQVAKRYRRLPSGAPATLRNLAEVRSKEEHWALRDVSFDVAEGETVALIGVNGSGKSSLLRLLAGISRPTRGRVVAHRRISGLLTLGEGFSGELSAEENAITGAILAGLTRREALSRLADIVAFAELEDDMDQPLRTFSDGMRLRLGFAVSVHVDPEILLIDEVLAVGDLRFQQKCLTHLEGLQADGVSVVLSTHEMGQVERLADRAVWLADGIVRHSGPAEEVADHYRQAMQGEMGAVTPRQDGSTRVGSGEVEIKAVRMVAGRNPRRTVLTSGAPLTIEIDYLTHVDVPGAIFGVSAHTEDAAVRCFDLSTATDGVAVGPLRGAGTVRLHLERVDLSGGSYRLDVGVYEQGWSHPYDYLWAAFPFEVRDPGATGMLNPPRRWELAWAPAGNPPPGSSSGAGPGRSAGAHQGSGR